jgi:excisionase family DNA binding protein
MIRPTQFGVRENTASPRQHAPRLAMRSVANQFSQPSNTSQERAPSASTSLSRASSLGSNNTAAHTAATVEEENHGKHLLTVQEVADLLQVPVSWVYGRTRKRSSERIPGYRLGKYWRFRQEEVLAWVEAQRRDVHVA